MGKMYQTGLLTFLAGFAIWNVDNIYCSTLTEWKKAIGWPTAFLLEGARSSPVSLRPLPLNPINRTFVVACFDRTQFLWLIRSASSHANNPGHRLVLDDAGQHL